MIPCPLHHRGSPVICRRSAPVTGFRLAPLLLLPVLLGACVGNGALLEPRRLPADSTQPDLTAASERTPQDDALVSSGRSTAEPRSLLGTLAESSDQTVPPPRVPARLDPSREPKQAPTPKQGTRVPSTTSQQPAKTARANQSVGSAAKPRTDPPAADSTSHQSGDHRNILEVLRQYSTTKAPELPR